MVEQVTEYSRFLTIGCLLFVSIKLLFSRPASAKKITCAVFALCTISYLLVDSDILQSSWIFYGFIFPTLILPVVFWLFSQVLFDDHFSLNFSKIAIVVISGVCLLIIFLAQDLNMTKGADNWNRILTLFHYCISFSFIVAGTLLATLNAAKDLINKRIQFRKIYFAVLALLILVTLISELTFDFNDPPPFLGLLQKLMILGLSFLFSFIILDVNNELINWEMKKPRVASINSPDNKLLDSLNILLSEQKIWKEETLTIGKLASLLNIKEYKLRQVINQYLGFNNFNDYLNSYRIEAACKMLTDPEKQEFTIVEIAYEVGFNSLSPFNKSFKRIKGMSPTLWRKTHL